MAAAITKEMLFSLIFVMDIAIYYHNNDVDVLSQDVGESCVPTSKTIISYNEKSCTKILYTTYYHNNDVDVLSQDVGESCVPTSKTIISHSVIKVFMLLVYNKNVVIIL